MEFRQKYLKYKKKYLEIKGGATVSRSVELHPEPNSNQLKIGTEIGVGADYLTNVGSIVSRLDTNDGWLLSSRIEIKDAKYKKVWKEMKFLGQVDDLVTVKAKSRDIQYIKPSPISVPNSNELKIGTEINAEAHLGSIVSRLDTKDGWLLSSGVVVKDTNYKRNGRGSWEGMAFYGRVNDLVAVEPDSKGIVVGRFEDKTLDKPYLLMNIKFSINCETSDSYNTFHFKANHFLFSNGDVYKCDQILYNNIYDVSEGNIYFDNIKFDNIKNLKSTFLSKYPDLIDLVTNNPTDVNKTIYFKLLGWRLESIIKIINRESIYTDDQLKELIVYEGVESESKLKTPLIPFKREVYYFREKQFYFHEYKSVPRQIMEHYENNNGDDILRIYYAEQIYNLKYLQVKISNNNEIINLAYSNGCGIEEIDAVERPYHEEVEGIDHKFTESRLEIIKGRIHHVHGGLLYYPNGEIIIYEFNENDIFTEKEYNEYILRLDAVKSITNENTKFNDKASPQEKVLADVNLNKKISDILGGGKRYTIKYSYK